MASQKYIPRRCVFEATLACNLRCRHCGSKAGKARPDELSTNETRDLFRQLRDLGCERITISGGEPMARKDWPEVIEAASVTGMKVGMITNGITFDREAAKQAKAMGLDAAGFSVDGPRETHDYIRGKVGHFGRLARAMDACQAEDLKFAVVSFVNTRNIAKLDEMYDYIQDKGAFAWQIQLGTDMGNLHDSENRDLLIPSTQLPRLEGTLAGLVHKKGNLRVDVADSIGYFGFHEKTLRSSQKKKAFNGCPAGINVVGIESNGNVKGCLSIMAGYNEQGADFVEGNIREHSLSEIWFREGAFAYNREWKLENLGGFCRECRHAKQCRGGCRAKVTASGGGVENPMCIHRVAVEEGLYRHNRAPYAAAVIASSLLGMAGCREAGTENTGVDAYGAPFDTFVEPDTGTGAKATDTESDTGTGETPTDVMEYGIPLDTDSETNGDTATTEIDEYGIFMDSATEPPPDTGDSEILMDYGIPWDSDTVAPPDTETESVAGTDIYGIPMDSDTRLPPDTDIETDTTFADAYGIPFDTDTGTGEPRDTGTSGAEDAGPGPDTMGIDEYGIFLDSDTGYDVPVYSMPFDTEAVVTEDTETAGGVDVYGMPAAPEEEEG